MHLYDTSNAPTHLHQTHTRTYNSNTFLTTTEKSTIFSIYVVYVWYYLIRPMECHDNEIVLNVICSLTHPVVEMNFICIYDFSVSEIHLDTYLAVDTSSSSHYGSRGGLAWTPPASGEGSTPTWTEGTPSFTDSSSSGDFGKFANTPTYRGRNSRKLRLIEFFPQRASLI